jgi:hypothetical protein
MVPSDPDQLRNDILNFIVKETLTLERLGTMDGRNITRTYGYKPNFVLRVLPNPYLHSYQQQQQQKQYVQQQQQEQFQMQQNIQPGLNNMMQNPTLSPQMQSKRKRQNTPSALGTYPPNQPIGVPGTQNYVNQIPNQPLNNQQLSGNIQTNQQLIGNNQYIPNNDNLNRAQYGVNPQYPNQVLGGAVPNVNPDASVYEQFVAENGGVGQNVDGLGISSKLPKDQVRYFFA